MYPEQSNADVFYTTRILWALLPFIATILCVLVWLLVSKLKKVDNLIQKIKATIVILLNVLWPGLCSATFAIFSCQNVCGASRLQFDLSEPCEGERNRSYVLFLGIPMFLVFVVGLPLLAMIMVVRVHWRSKEQKRKLYKMKGHYVFGLFYAAYHPDVWWWESTVALRKIMISLIGVFGGSMGTMQVHLTAFMMVIIMLLTAIVRPFGNHFLLQLLDLATLAAVWLTLWAGTVFNDGCKDCYFLSVFVCVVLVGCFVMVVVVTVHYKRKPPMLEADRRRWSTARFGEEENGEEENGEEEKAEEEGQEQEQETSNDTSTATEEQLGIETSDQETVKISQEDASTNVTPKKQRRLSSREFMREQSTHPVKDVEMIQLPIREDGGAEDGGGEDGGGEDGGGETKVTGGETKITMHENPHWSKLKKSVKATNVFKAGGKKRAKRLSRVMKARHNSATSDKNESSNIAIEVNENSGN